MTRPAVDGTTANAAHKGVILISRPAVWAHR
jgi:hypothetical protein